MNYTALYRQFRPQSFNELVGQSHISTTLLNGIRSGKIAHAYLFTGPRGTGKTSTAKIFAKAINCSSAENGEPCNTCDNCGKITKGNSLDVIEIDAASNRGIDEIRDLREKVKYAPAEGNFKVYIIDEVHMLTTEAFNALLKTLEEPPAHIVFILATTEPHKLPATIISRCQRFDFKRIAFADLQEHLKKVSKEVDIDIEEKALFVIAKKAEGGLRDALSLLDQSAAFGNGKVTYETVLEILGAVKESEILVLLKAIFTQNAQKMLTLIEAYVNEGKDLKTILYDLQEAVRNAILVKLSPQKPEMLDEDTFTELQKLVQNVRKEKLFHILEVLSETENILKYASQARITLEVGLLKTIISEDSNPDEHIMVEKPQKLAKTVTNTKTESNTKTAPAAVPQKTHQPEAVTKEAWEKILAETKKTKRILHAYLVEGNAVAFSNNILKIEFDYEKDFHYQQITSPEHYKVITQLAKKILGEDIKIEFNLKAKTEEDITKKIFDMFGKEKVEVID